MKTIEYSHNKVNNKNKMLSTKAKSMMYPAGCLTNAPNFMKSASNKEKMTSFITPTEILFKIPENNTLSINSKNKWKT